MASTEQFQTRQGLFGARVALEIDEVATVKPLRHVFWEKGGVSVTLFPDRNADGSEAGAGGELKYEHSLSDEGEWWTEDLDSPYSAESDTLEISENHRITRLRVTAGIQPGVFEILSPVDMSIETS